VADTFQNAWQQAHPTGTVTVRDLGRNPLPYLTWEGYTARSIPEAERTPEQREAVARSAALVDELLATDTILLAVPLYNWGTPASSRPGSTICSATRAPATRRDCCVAERPCS
jgi:FMN-dependent NADH-azoreductase